MIFIGFVLILFILIFGFGSFFLLDKNKKNFLRIYISGPMTGIEDNNAKDFHYMELKILDNFDFVSVVNPIDISNKTDSWNLNPTYEDYLREDFRKLIDCDAVILLEGWKNSGGCKKEVTVANYLKIPCFETFEELKKYLEENNGCKN